MSQLREEFNEIWLLREKKLSPITKEGFYGNSIIFNDLKILLFSQKAKLRSKTNITNDKTFTKEKRESVAQVYHQNSLL